AQVVDGVAAVAPGGIADIACADHVMQRRAFAERGRRCFAGAAVHARQPPFAGKLHVPRIGYVDNRQNVVDEAAEMHRDIGVFAADPPDAVRAEAGGIEEADFSRVGGSEISKAGKPAAEGLSVWTE